MKGWAEGSKDPNKELKRIEKEMQSLLLDQQDDKVRSRIVVLQDEFARYIVA